MTRILAIDPGTTQSGWIRMDDGKIIESGTSTNERVLDRIRVTGSYITTGLLAPVTLAIERFEARGMPIGDESIETIIWTGRFKEAWHEPDAVVFVKRSAVKLALCGTSRAKDVHVRQALIDRFGAKGTKKAPGPTYGVTSHAWSALAVVAAYIETEMTCG